MELCLSEMTAEALAGWVSDARDRTFRVVDDLTDDQLQVPYLSIVNPMVWELCHIAWFQEHWILRHALGQPAVMPDSGRMFDSTNVAHERRWYLELPTRKETFDYLTAVHDRVLEVLGSEKLTPELRYFVQLGVFHEDMHDEAFVYMRQALGYPAPDTGQARELSANEPFEAHDVNVPGGPFRLGAEKGTGFVFDNEKWAHDVEIQPFSIARACVTQGEFARFVDDGGYKRAEFWSPNGWRWLQSASAQHPLYWRSDDGGWKRRHFDSWVELEPELPMIHVNWYEVDAWCRWAGRRLPTEAEWEAAALAELDGDRLAPRRRAYPWGATSPESGHGNLDARVIGCVAGGEMAAGDSAVGCRQMLGNVWEWTDSTFLPYPGFVTDPYEQYSEPWFGSRKVLRGGSYATRGRLIRGTWRNYYTPDRRDVLAGFRTCAV